MRGGPSVPPQSDLEPGVKLDGAAPASSPIRTRTRDFRFGCSRTWSIRSALRVTAEATARS
jgi:hypothetical protein